jgi:aldose sugar dehydrogenase
MTIRQTAMLAAILALASGQAAPSQTSAQTRDQAVEKPAPGPPSPDPCAPSQYAKDDYFPKPAFPGQTRAPRPPRTEAFKVETVASGLERPIALAVLGDGRILASSRTGLRLIDRDGRLSPPIAGGPASLDAYDFALDRDFAADRTIYFIYRAPNPAEVVPAGGRPIGIGRVARARISADWTTLEDVKTIFEGMYPRRIVQTPDGDLLVSTMDANGANAQNPGQLAGKMLRIKADGSAAAGAAFAKTEGARPEVFTLGHRDPDGLTLDRASGQVWSTEHGPRGGDELNRIRGGLNYGYPTISYGREYDGQLIDGGKTAQPGLEQPVYFWDPDIAPSGLVVYRGSMFPAWNGDIFIAALVGKTLVRLRMKDGKVAGEEPVLSGRCERYRDVAQGPDGSLYVLTDGPAASILRLSKPR